MNNDEKYENDELAEFDAFLKSIKDAVISDEMGTSFLNLRRLEDINFVYNVMRFLTKDTGVNVTYELHEPVKNFGSVSLDGVIVGFNNSKLFRKAADLADNMEVYSLLNGHIMMTFGFYKLTVPIK